MSEYENYDSLISSHNPSSFSLPSAISFVLNNRVSEVEAQKYLSSHEDCKQVVWHNKDQKENFINMCMHAESWIIEDQKKEVAMRETKRNINQMNKEVLKMRKSLTENGILTEENKNRNPSMGNNEEQNHHPETNEEEKKQINEKYLQSEHQKQEQGLDINQQRKEKKEDDKKEQAQREEKSGEIKNQKNEITEKEEKKSFLQDSKQKQNLNEEKQQENSYQKQNQMFQKEKTEKKVYQKDQNQQKENKSEQSKQKNQQMKSAQLKVDKKSNIPSQNYFSQQIHLSTNTNQNKSLSPSILNSEEKMEEYKKEESKKEQKKEQKEKVVQNFLKKQKIGEKKQKKIETPQMYLEKLRMKYHKKLEKVFEIYGKQMYQPGQTFEQNQMEHNLMDLRLFLKYYREYDLSQYCKVTEATKLFKKHALHRLWLNKQKFIQIHKEILEVPQKQRIEEKIQVMQNIHKNIITNKKVNKTLNIHENQQLRAIVQAHSIDRKEDVINRLKEKKLDFEKKHKEQVDRIVERYRNQMMGKETKTEKSEETSKLFKLDSYSKINRLKEEEKKKNLKQINSRIKSQGKLYNGEIQKKQKMGKKEIYRQLSLPRLPKRKLREQNIYEALKIIETKHETKNESEVIKNLINSSEKQEQEYFNSYLAHQKKNRPEYLKNLSPVQQRMKFT